MLEPMPVAYVAGPYRDPRGAWFVEQNIRRAEAVAVELWRMGFAVICPHTNTRHFDGAAPDSVWLTGDREIMRRCDVVVFYCDFDHMWASEGSRAEMEDELARDRGVYFWEGSEHEGRRSDREMLTEWLEDWQRQRREKAE